jgi:hypothetical protein
VIDTIVAREMKPRSSCFSASFRREMRGMESAPPLIGIGIMSMSGASELAHQRTAMRSGVTRVDHAGTVASATVQRGTDD